MSIKTAVLDGVYTIEIARPEKKNAITQEMYQAMADALIAAGFDHDAMQVTHDLTTVGNPVESLLFSVRWGGAWIMSKAQFEGVEDILSFPNDPPVSIGP